MQNHQFYFDPRTPKYEALIEALANDKRLAASDRCLTMAFRRCGLDSNEFYLVDPILERAEQLYGVRWYDLSMFELDGRDTRELLLPLLRWVIRTTEARASVLARSNVIPMRHAGRPP